MARLNRIGLAIASAAAIILMLMISVDVVMRRLFASELPGVNALSTYLVVYMAFASVSWTLAQRAHVQIDSLGLIIRGRGRRIQRLWVNLVGLAYTGVFGLFTGLETWRVFHILDRSPAISLLPMWLVWVIMPIGFVLMGGQFVQEIAAELVGMRSDQQAAAALQSPVAAESPGASEVN